MIIRLCVPREGGWRISGFLAGAPVARTGSCANGTASDASLWCPFADARASAPRRVQVLIVLSQCRACNSPFSLRDEMESRIKTNLNGGRDNCSQSAMHEAYRCCITPTPSTHAFEHGSKFSFFFCDTLTGGSRPFRPRPCAQNWCNMII